MKLQTNYETMTDEELFIELEHRFHTLNETLGGYQTGGLQATLETTPMWLDYLEFNEHGMLLSLSFTFEGDEHPLVMDATHSHFRSVLLSALAAKWQLYTNDEFDEERDQQEELEDMKCVVCVENCTPTTPESLEALPGPIPGHFDVPEIPPIQWEPELTTVGFHTRQPEWLDTEAYQQGHLRVENAPQTTTTALVPYFVYRGIGYDVEVQQQYEQNNFHTKSLQSWRHFEGEKFKHTFNPPLLFRVGPDNRGW